MKPVTKCCTGPAALRGKYGLEKVSLNYKKIFSRNSKIIAVLSSSLLKCDKSTLRLSLSHDWTSIIEKY